MRKFLKRMTGIFLCVAMAAGVYGAIPAYAEGTDTGTDIQEQAAQWPFIYYFIVLQKTVYNSI